MADTGLVTADFMAAMGTDMVAMVVTHKAGPLMQQQILVAEIPAEEMEEEVYDYYYGA
jgi:hypothetical protein